MGDYVIKDSLTGAMMKVRGDSAPTQQEAAQLFSDHKLIPSAPKYSEDQIQKLEAGRASSNDPSKVEAQQIVDKAKNLPSAEAIAGNPIYRALQGAADLPIGAAQLVENLAVGGHGVIGADNINGFVNRREDLMRRGREQSGSSGFDVPRMLGSIPNAVMTGGASTPADGATAVQKIIAAIKPGVALGVAQPTEGNTSGDVLKGKAISGGENAALVGLISGGTLAIGAGIKKAAQMLPMSVAAAAEKLGAVLREISGNKADQVVEAIRKNAPADLPPTAEQALNGMTPGMASVEAGSPGFSAWDDLMSRKSGVRLDDRAALNNARVSLHDFAGTADDIAKAVEERGKIYSGVLEQPISGDKELARILRLHAMEGVVNDAKKVTEDQLSQAGAGNKRFGAHIPEGAAGRFLQNVKNELGADINSLGRGSPLTRETATNTNLQQALDAKDRLVQWMADNIPGYDKARGAFADASKPIDQMQIAQKLRGNLTGTASNYAEDALANNVDDVLPNILKQRASTYQNALNNEAQTIKTSSGKQVYKTLADAFGADSQPMEVFKQVSNSLGRESRLAELVKEGSTMTSEELKGLRPSELPHFLNKAVTLVNSTLEKMGDKQINSVEKLYIGMRENPRAIADLMEKAGNPPEISNFMKMMDFAAKNKLAGAQLSAAITNDLSESRKRSNP
jgi:hypothetical protein